ncbi:MAG: single-stranded DNA-binding protein [Thermoanaerobaculum sp.]|nr:single-stranded DNA-binding protein [Thermoanaerobaculum sp.]
MSVNKVIIVGNVGREVELRHTPAGLAVARFSVATNERWRDKDGNRQERTQWHTVVAWGKLAEFCQQYVSKGRQVYVEGSLRTRTYDDEKGNRRYFTEIHAQTIQLLGRREGAVEGGAEEAFEAPPEGEDDIPF